MGHNQMQLTPDDTLENMYLSRLHLYLECIKEQFPRSREDKDMETGSNYIHGLFYNDPAQTLDLWVDIKTDANDTYRVLQEQLRPLIDSGYLTSYSEEKGVVHGPITVTLTGNVPWELIEADDDFTRYVFLDCPLYDFGDVSEATMARFRKLCKYASTSHEREERAGRWLGSSASRVNVKIAHENGIKARIWGGPEWPRRVKTDYWDKLLQDGYDLINTDDISYAASQY